MTDMELRLLMGESVQKCHRALFDKYCNYVYAIVINILRNCGSREDMEDCVSDVFFKLYKQLDSGIEFSGDLKNYIAAIARNTAIDTFRKISHGSSRNVSIDDDTVTELPSDERVEENADKKERSRIILSKIKQLGEPDTTIIIQQYFYDRTAKEIAESVSMTAAAVQKRSSRARQRLKAMLCEAGLGKEDLI